jgi:hypothetical protein
LWITLKDLGGSYFAQLRQCVGWQRYDQSVAHFWELLLVGWRGRRWVSFGACF